MNVGINQLVPNVILLRFWISGYNLASIIICYPSTYSPLENYQPHKQRKDSWTPISPIKPNPNALLVYALNDPLLSKNNGLTSFQVFLKPLPTFQASYHEFNINVSEW